jgi:Ca2+-binding RTX toxin-like protein
MPRTRLALALTTAAALGLASPALADTKVSIESGNFGTGLNGLYLFVRDAPSFPFDAAMDTVVKNDGTKIRITDALGDVVAGSGCTALSNGDAQCPSGLDGALIWGGNKGDKLTNLTSLPAAWDGDSGNDVVNGGPGPDQLKGGPGDDTLHGNGGNDGFVHEPGSDDVRGGEGTDTASYAGSPELVKVRLDNSLFDDGPVSEPDRLLTFENLIGSPFNDFLRANDFRNVISARGGHDMVLALDGDDAINGNAGGDTIFGGEGDEDTVTYADRAAPVEVSLNNIDGDGEGTENDDIRTDVENLEGGTGDDKLSGHPSVPFANDLDGNGGDDRLDGGAGNDSSDGGADDDTITGDVGTDVYEGGAGTDTIDYSNRSGEFTEPVKVTLENSILLDDGGPSDGQGDNVHNIENATTGDGADVLTGAPGKNVMKAGAGEDEIFADDGFEDVADCGPGNDGVKFDLGLDLTPDCEFILP